MRNFINWLLGRNKVAPKKVERMTSKQYDDLVGEKLMGIRQFLNANLEFRDGDKLFDNNLSEAFLRYENVIKNKVGAAGNVDTDTILISPNGAMDALITALYAGTGRKKKPWYKKRLRFELIRSVKKYYYRLKFRIQMYLQHIMLMREIRKMRKLFPHRTISNQHLVHIINATKLNKRVQELHPNY